MLLYTSPDSSTPEEDQVLSTDDDLSQQEELGSKKRPGDSDLNPQPLKKPKLNEPENVSAVEVSMSEVDYTTEGEMSQSVVEGSKTLEQPSEVRQTSKKHPTVQSPPKGTQETTMSEPNQADLTTDVVSPLPQSPAAKPPLSIPRQPVSALPQQTPTSQTPSLHTARFQQRPAQRPFMPNQSRPQPQATPQTPPKIPQSAQQPTLQTGLQDALKTTPRPTGKTAPQASPKVTPQAAPKAIPQSPAPLRSFPKIPAQTGTPSMLQQHRRQQEMMQQRHEQFQQHIRRSPSPEKENLDDELDKEVECQSDPVAVQAMKNQLLNKAITGQCLKSPQKEFLCRDCKMPFTRKGDREYVNHFS